MKDAGTLLALLLAFLLITGLRQKPKPGPSPGPGPGLVGSGGSIGSITVANTRMGQPTKIIGVDTTVKVTVSGITFSTTRDGITVSWPYVARLHRGNLTGGPVEIVAETSAFSGLPQTNSAWTTNVPVGTVEDDYRFVAQLFAAAADSQGNPMADLVKIAEFIGDHAYSVRKPAPAPVPEPRPVVVISTGAIGGVVGAQQRTRRVYIRGHFREGIAASQSSARIFAGRR